MRQVQAVMVVAVVMLSACNRSQPKDTPPQANMAVPPAAVPAPAPQPPAPSTAPQPLPPATPPAAAPDAQPGTTDAAADPKSVGAALDVARQFADLLTARKFDQAYALLGGRGGFASVADFKRQFAPYSGLNVTVLEAPAPEPEGAAGSIYLSVPVELSGLVDGRRVQHPATVTLRRVNDVPGSTEAQRRWHVEGFDDAAK